MTGNRVHRVVWSWSGSGINPNGSPGTFGGSGSAIDDSFVASNVYNPSWRQQIRSGANATTSRTWDGYAGDTLSFSAHVEWFYQGTPPLAKAQVSGTYMPSLPTFPAASASVVTSVHNRAIRQFLSRCESARSAFQSGQDIGELKETIESVINPMRSLRDLTHSYLDKAKRIARRKGKGPSIAKALADTYLEYRFGWNPLAADVAAGISDIKSQQMSPWTAVEGSAAQPFYSSESFWSINIIAGALVFPYRVTGTYQERFRGSVSNGSVDGTRPLAQELQLDLPHFLPTVWNLIPYSWIVDYFTNVGDFIDGLCFQPSNLRWCNWTRRTEWKISFKSGYWSNSNGNPSFDRVKFVTVSPGSFRRVSGVRQIYAGDFVPTLEFQIPISSRPWENIGALLLSWLA